jgi:DNA polymerase I-like protein with 3'-5' exonuclease and polymerase domains
MKLSAVLLRDEIIRLGLDAVKVGDIHDEGQFDVLTEHAELFGQTAVSCIEQAGKILGLNVPVTGFYKIGVTWAETH